MGLIEQIEKDAKSAVGACAREIKKEIKQSALTSAAQFYNAYSPYAYERTWGLFTAYKEIDLSSGTSRTVGVEFSADQISTSHKVSNDAVFEWSWEGGYHGYPGFAGTAHTISPKNAMDQKFAHTLSRVPGIIQRNFARYFR